MSVQKSVVIIGGGASGVLTALALLKHDTSAIQLCIVDPSPELGRGRAYDQAATIEILNVPAAKMSADLDKPNEFVDWLKTTHAIGSDLKSWPFVPRALYGEYLHSLIQPHIGHRLEHRKSRVVGVELRGEYYEIELSNGDRLKADAVALCTGFVPMPVPLVGGQIMAGKSKQILVIGSGLTAIDSWLRYRSSEKDGVKDQLTFLSRHGFLPLPHLADPKAVRLPPLHGLSPKQLLRVIREIQILGSLRWQDVADSVRNQVHLIWSCWSKQERSQFVRHLKVYWEIIRHRIPSPILDQLQADINGGTLKVLAGRVREPFREKAGVISGVFVPRGNTIAQITSFDIVVDATGARIDQTLVQGKNQISGLRTCELGFGFINESAPHLWLVGPASKSATWETTAIAEIRIQTEKIAIDVLAAMDRAMDRAMNGPGIGLGRLATHPRQVGETYSEHFFIALGYSWSMAGVAFALLVHAFVPTFFVTFGSEKIRNVSQAILRRRVSDIFKARVARPIKIEKTQKEKPTKIIG